MTWEEICSDRYLANSPYRVESDKYGNIVMSPPPGFNHSRNQGGIAEALVRLLPHGFILPECPIRTAEGVKAADVAWMSFERHAQLPVSFLECPIAPEICIEVRSPSNSYREILEKLELYFKQGAKECWMCDQTGYITFFNTDGQIPQSELCPEFPTQLSRGG